MAPFADTGRTWKLDDLRRILPLAGGVLIAAGVLRRSPLSVLFASVGGALLYETVVREKIGTSPLLGAPLANESLYEKGMPTLQTLSHQRGVRVEREIMVQRSPEDLYRFWRNLENLPRVMRYLQSVREFGPIHSHWVSRVPPGIQVVWDAEIIHDEANRRIGWRSLKGADVPNAGSVQFEPLDGIGTLVRVNFKYDVPAHPFGITLAKLLGSDLERMVTQDLLRFKNFMEMNMVYEGLPPRLS